MSLIVTVCTNEGMVMASDSRTTYNNLVTGERGVYYSDTSYKTFLCGDKIGISCCGDADVDGKPIAGLVENFIKNVYNGHDVATTAKLLSEHFSSMAANKQIHFFVAGYSSHDNIDKKVVYEIKNEQKICNQLCDNDCNAYIDGENDVVMRLYRHGFLADPENYFPMDNLTLSNENGEKTNFNNVILLTENRTEIFESQVAWNLMTLQDAVDFARYTIQTTAETMRFQQRLKTVGGPVDVLIIKPTGASFLTRKELK